jgi:hypothetical protein
MTDKADHIAWAAEAIAVFQAHCRTGDEHAIADLICDLGHLAEDRGFDFISEVKRGIGHWYAEHHAGDGELRTREIDGRETLTNRFPEIQ